MRTRVTRAFWAPFATALAILVCYSFQNQSTGMQHGLALGTPATQAANTTTTAAESNRMDEILGTVPEAKSDLPTGTVVFIRSGHETHTLSDFTDAAKARIAKEEKTPPPPSAHVQILLNTDSTEAFAEVIVGSGVGTPHWIVTMDRHAKVTNYKKTLSRG